MNWYSLGITSVVAIPALALIGLALPVWFGARLAETSISRVVAFTFTTCTIASLALLIIMQSQGVYDIETSLGSWFTIGHYRFIWRFVGDHLSLPFATFSALLLGLVGAFSRRYVHQEPGFFRFYLLLTLFGAGVELVVLAGTLDLIFFGWELVGISSALLIAFFHDRPKPVEHGLRAFVTYRVCDIGLLAAALWLHYSVGSTAIDDTAGPWAGLPVPASVTDATIVGLLLLWATMGKSAQVPLGGWLPRAMEGPTPSSAIFYGAISVHLGPYLLLRAAPILEAVPAVAIAVVVVGGLTALHATFVGRVQSDIKSALAYASMTQVGIIYVEIGLGLRYLALIHIVAHATLRSLQILRSPSLLHDRHHLEQSMGRQLPRVGGHLESLVPRTLQPWLYRHALERGYFDALVRDRIVGGFARIFRGIDALDRAWTRILGGSAPVSTPSRILEDDR